MQSKVAQSAYNISEWGNNRFIADRPIDGSLINKNAIRILDSIVKSFLFQGFEVYLPLRFWFSLVVFSMELDNWYIKSIVKNIVLQFKLAEQVHNPIERGILDLSPANIKSLIINKNATQLEWHFKFFVLRFKVLAFDSVSWVVFSMELDIWFFLSSGFLFFDG